jgi:hypothetical protein
MAEDPKREPSRKRTLQEVNTALQPDLDKHERQNRLEHHGGDASEWVPVSDKLRYGIGTGELERRRWTNSSTPPGGFQAPAGGERGGRIRPMPANPAI